MRGEILDVAVVGGGVSGVYSAWRLLTQGRKRLVTVFEADDHIGGRLLSVTPPGIPNMSAELGGMRILPAVQPRIKKLIELLNTEAGPTKQIETYPFPVDEANNISYLRGVYLRLSDFSNNPDKVPYHLAFQEDNKTAGAIVLGAIEQVVPGITKEGLSEEERREMARKAKFDGRPLYEQGFWQVLMRVISCEAYQLAIAAGGYESTLTNWNAADAIPWYLSDFGITPSYFGFKKGFQQVPLTLAELIKEAGGEIECGAKVTGFDVKGKVIELHFENRESVRTNSLILAMPRRSLELLAPGTPFLRDNKEVTQLIKSVTPRPLFKLFTTYECPWWLPAGVKAGRTTTDLPVRQTYYWPKNDGTPATEGRAMLMASYDDGLNIGFWDGFRARRGVGWREGVKEEQGLEEFLGAADKAKSRNKEWLKYHAPKAMVEEMQRQLAIIHGLQFTPHVTDASFKDWGDDPFGGGWNSWNISVKSWEVKEKILRPVKGAKVYICGEAYSNAQGWVEGALETADLMLEDKAYFGLPPLPDLAK
jgi:monoamine oxidase